MNYFDNYVSNTLAASANQYFFNNENENEIFTGRVFYKVFAGGRYNYSFLFSNTIDSTYSDGKKSYKNLVCDEWKIHRAAVAVFDYCDMASFSGETEFITLKFDGKTEKTVIPGELFTSDPVTLNAEKDKYICVEVSFSGRMIPYHEETVIPTFLFKDGKWIPCKKVIFPGMTGCDRPVKKRVAFFGDSITQGIGPEPNSYGHWDAVLSEKLGTAYSFWNLGIGYARADDGASGGVWLSKAKKNDIAVVCFGVNDIGQGFSEEKIKENLFKIVKELKESGLTVLLQTVPPFYYEGERKIIWENVNKYILTELSRYCDSVFDVVPLLRESKECPQNPKYGGHPDENGSKIWAEAMFSTLNKLL